MASLRVFANKCEPMPSGTLQAPELKITKASRLWQKDWINPFRRLKASPQSRTAATKTAALRAVVCRKR